MRRYKSCLLLWLVILISCSSCLKKPEVGFSYQPYDNPETGEEIAFVNESMDALYFHWDFGNGETSEEENPTTIFEVSGDYTVTLTVENKIRKNTLSQEIKINEPTVLEVFFYSNDGTPLTGGPTNVWESQERFELNDDPLLSGITDNKGKVSFPNIEPLSYYVYFEQNVEGGIYKGGSPIGPLKQNQKNIYRFNIFFQRSK